jgi:hypothetical protein
MQIRINPGNFADGRKTFEEINYDDPAEFEAERVHIEETFTPLVRVLPRQMGLHRRPTNCVLRYGSSSSSSGGSVRGSSSGGGSNSGSSSSWNALRCYRLS